MKHPKILAISISLLCCVGAGAKGKKKILLPADVLQAQTVLVVIEPEAGMNIEAPMGNRKAQDDVEKALMNWGRFRLVEDVSSADLVISLRKGSGKLAQPTIGGIPQNNRPVILQPSDSGGRAGGSAGTPPQYGDPTRRQSPDPTPQVEVGEPDDMFVVYRGKRDNALDSPPVWRYSARDALRSPSVPAVDVFRRLIIEAEKQQAANP